MAPNHARKADGYRDQRKLDPDFSIVSRVRYMDKHQTKKLDRKTQRERFEETARALECDEDEDRFNANLKQW